MLSEILILMLNFSNDDYKRLLIKVSLTRLKER